MPRRTCSRTGRRTGTKIVFRSEREGGGLFVVPALGGAERRLTVSGQYPRWSPDGTRVLFQPGQMVPGLATSHLLIVGLDGAPPREIWPDFSFVGAASWHPDGRTSVLGVHKTLGPGLFTGSPDAPAPVRSAIDRELAQQLGDFGLLSSEDFRWGPNGTTLYLEVADRGVQNLWRATVDAATLRITAVERLTTGPTRDARVAIAPSGSRLAFTPSTESVRLWSVPIDAATGRLKGEPVAITDDGLRVGTSDLSSDGTKLLYEVQRTGQQERELWSADLLSGRSQPLYRRHAVSRSTAVGARQPPRRLFPRGTAGRADTTANGGRDRWAWRRRAHDHALQARGGHAAGVRRTRLVARWPLRCRLRDGQRYVFHCRAPRGRPGGRHSEADRALSRRPL